MTLYIKLKIWLELLFYGETKKMYHAKTLIGDIFSYRIGNFQMQIGSSDILFIKREELIFSKTNFKEGITGYQGIQYKIFHYLIINIYKACQTK